MTVSGRTLYIYVVGTGTVAPDRRVASRSYPYPAGAGSLRHAPTKTPDRTGGGGELGAANGRARNLVRLFDHKRLLHKQRI